MIKKIPIPICGLALSYAVLGNLLESYSPMARIACGMVSLCILLLFVAKVLSDVPTFQKECQQAPMLSTLPTFSMAIIILSTYVRPLHSTLGILLWIFGLCLHFILLTVFSWKFLRSFQFGNVSPSWFIVYVGFVTGSVSAPAMGQKNIGLFLLVLGFLFYALVFVFVVYRLVKIGKLPTPLLPTLSIFTAPVGLCLAGTLRVTTNPSPFGIGFLLVLLVANYSFAVQNAFRLAFSQFYPSFSAFTFPMVISALAFKMATANNPALQTSATLLLLFGIIGLAVFFVGIVTVRYFIFLTRES